MVHALVTGSGSGIGAAVVLRPLDEGMSVTALDRDPDGLNRTLSAARSPKGTVPGCLRCA